MGILGWVVLGGLAGWTAALLLHERQGCLTHVIVGVLGALLGGFLFSLAGARPVVRFDLWSLFVAVIGSVALLAVVRALRRT